MLALIYFLGNFHKIFNVILIKLQKLAQKSINIVIFSKYD